MLRTHTKKLKLCDDTPKNQKIKMCEQPGWRIGPHFSIESSVFLFAFSAQIKVSDEIEVVSQSDTIVPVKQQDIIEQQSQSPIPHIKVPRKAIRIKRTKKKFSATRPSRSHKQLIAAAAKSQVELPKFPQMSAAKSNRGAVNVDLETRSSRI